MTKDEALKLALEALEEAWYHVGTFQPTEKAIDLYDEARIAIKKALAEQEQEPVAVKHMMRWVDNLKWQSENGQHMNIPSGLSSGTCWELAIELENFIKHTNFPQIAISPEIVGYVAPQRTWVGLTDEEIEQGCKESWVTEQAWQSAEWWAEAKLKEKNTLLKNNRRK